MVAWGGCCMKIEEKIQKISEMSQRRMERVAIILGVSLLLVSSISYFTIEAFGQLDNVGLTCPKDAYYGFDNQGNTVCRDIETNKILESESVVIVDSDSEKITKSEPWIITDSEIGEIILNEDQAPIAPIIIFSLIGVGVFIGLNAKNKNFKILKNYASKTLTELTE